MSKKVLLLIYLILAITHSHARAQHKTTALNENNIRRFIYETTDITSGSVNNLSSKKTTDYLEKHLHKDSRFKTTMRYSIPGHAPQENTMSFNKPEFIENVRQSIEKTVSEYKNDVQIISIQIAQNKKAATIETRSFETATMPIIDETGIQGIPMEGKSLCHQIIKLSKKGTIQMYNVSCVTDITFTTDKL